MDVKNDFIVQSSISMIVNTEDICPEYPQNLPKKILEICLEHPQNLSGTSWGWPTSPRVPNGVPNNLGKFPKGPQVPGTREWRVRGFFWGGRVPVQHRYLVDLCFQSHLHFFLLKCCVYNFKEQISTS
jgi:hypothetical protein